MTRVRAAWRRLVWAHGRLLAAQQPWCDELLHWEEPAPGAPPVLCGWYVPGGTRRDDAASHPAHELGGRPARRRQRPARRR